ncbi:MAG: multiheme c-type cytochrome, partial [Planctomycetia bacterium]
MRALHVRWFVASAAVVAVGLLIRPSADLHAESVDAPPAALPTAAAYSVVVDAHDPLALKYNGASSCSAQACHGDNGKPGAVGSEYSTWIFYDPHARAHESLYEPLSQQIVKKMKLATAAHQTELCLKCHSFAVPKERQTSRFTAEDGVACEACHGPSEKWLAPHQYKSFAEGMTREQKKAQGLWNAAAPGEKPHVAARVDTCVACHVGSPDKQVDHILIAAGHPRLNFEAGAYMANYPKHWDAGKERLVDPSLEARTWAVGQLTTLAGALDLLAHRATEAEKTLSTGKDAASWPEFSEYDCYACHHDLADPSWRQQRGYAGVRPGQLPWNSWYWAAPATSLTKGMPHGAAMSVPNDLLTIQKLMAQPLPPTKKIAAKAMELAGNLRNWAAEVENASLSDAELVKLLDALSTEDPLADGNWDAAAQRYLGLSAV